MEKPQRAWPAGAYKKNSALRLVSVPVEPVDQGGGNRLDIRFHVFSDGGRPTRGRKDGQVGTVKAGVSVFAAQEEASRQRQAKESRQRDFRTTAEEPAAIRIRADDSGRRPSNSVGKVDLIKLALGIAAIPVGEDVRGDHVADPSADGPGRRFFFLASESAEGALEIVMQIHELIIGEGAHDPIAPAGRRAELIVAAAAHCAEPTATTRSGGGCNGGESRTFPVMVDGPQAITSATIDITAGPARGGVRRAAARCRPAPGLPREPSKRSR